MEKKWWVLIVVIVVLVLVGVYSASDDVALSPIVKKGVEIIPISGEELEDSQVWRDFESKYGDKWTAKWNLRTKTPTRILGGSIDSSSFGIDSVTPNNIDSLAKTFIHDNTNLFQIDTSNLEVIAIQGDNPEVIKYQQIYNGLDVFGGHVMTAVKNDKIVLYGANYYPDILISTKAEIGENEAIIRAKNFFGVPNVDAQGAELLIYPRDDNYFLSYRVDLPVIENPDLLLREEKPYIAPSVLVDAIDGRVIYFFDNLVYDDLTGTVTGMIYPKFSDEPQIEVPFEHEWVNADSEQGVTDENGAYVISGLSGDVTVEALLEGPWADIQNEQQERASHVASVTAPGTHDWNWKLDGDDTSYKQEESNVFYHINVIHDYITKPSLNVTEMNQQVEINVNDPNHCNAYFISGNPPSIFLLSAGNGCESTALDAGVIYHEYGHGINDELVGLYWPYSCEPGNMDEGFADYWGCTILNDPCHGRYHEYGECGRRCDTDDRYPEDRTCQRHSGAQIISGTFWDIREIYGADYTDKLVVDALRMQPFSFSELLENTLIADDDNADLSDGTPHIDDICHAFWDNHGMFNPWCIDHTLTGVAVITSPSYDNLNLFRDGNIIIEGTAYGTASEPLQSYVLEYASQDDPDNWFTDGVTLAGGEVIDGVLGNWNIDEIENGQYKIRLRVIYGSTEFSTHP
ncbi:MAG: M36 family metallopeptidase, partial [Nanoarchaeota archaeon]